MSSWSTMLGSQQMPMRQQIAHAMGPPQPMMGAPQRMMPPQMGIGAPTMGLPPQAPRMNMQPLPARGMRY